MSRGEKQMEEMKQKIINLIEQEELEKVKQLIDQLEQNAKSTSDVYFLNALYFIKIKNFDNAWLWLWRGLYDFPNDPGLNKLMSDILKILGRNKEADHYFQQLSKLGFENKNFTNIIPANLYEDEINPQTASQSSNHLLRVMQGTIEIANQMNTLSDALSKIGVYSKTLNYYPYYLNYQSDYEWSLLGFRSSPLLNQQQKKLAEQFLPQFDLFHFHFGTSMTFDYSDLPLYIKYEKPVIMQHWGSDIRLLSKAMENNPYSLVKNQNENQIHYMLTSLSDSIKHCIVPDMELYQYVKDYYENVFVIPSMINLDSYVPIKRNQRSQKPLIVHAPTSPYIKGTQYILKAIDTLKKQYHFDFRLIQGMSHQEAMKIYQEADLIIDQLHIGSYGLLAVEAMAMGKPVICWISDFMKENYPNDLPIISANPDTITKVLESILKNQDQLQEIGIKGRKYAEAYHDMNKNSLKVLEIYQSLSKQ